MTGRRSQDRLRGLSWLIVVIALSGIAAAGLVFLALDDAAAPLAVLGAVSLVLGLVGLVQLRVLGGVAEGGRVPAPPVDPTRGGLPVSQVTGLYLAWVFHQRLEEEMARDDRYGHYFAVMLLEPADLLALPSQDDYASAARELHRCLQPGDFAAQYDEERFVVLMPETDRDAAKAAGKNILLRLREVTPSHASWRGAVVTYPDDARTAEDILTTANDLLKPGRLEGAVRTAA